MTVMQQAFANAPTPPRDPNIKAPLIRTVFIAGMDRGDNPFVKICNNYMLKTVHWATNEAHRPLPVCDAAIVATDNCSHELMWRTKDAYKNKCLYLATQGYSSIKEAFEDDVFGDAKVLSILREPVELGGSSYTGTSIPLSTRIFWLLSRFLKRGEEFRIGELCEPMAKLLKLGETQVKSNFSNILTTHKAKGCFTKAGGYGWNAYHGMPPNVYNQCLTAGIPVERDWVVGSTPSKVVQVITPSYAASVAEKSLIPLTLDDFPSAEIPTTPTTAPVVEPQPVFAERFEEEATPVNVLKKLDQETNATMELLLESMSKQLQEMENLKTSIPLIIQKEISGITRLIGNLMPKIQGLTPEEVGKVDQLLDLFLSMRK